MRPLLIATVLILVLAGGYWRWQHPAHPAPVNASSYETEMVENLVRGILPELATAKSSLCFLAFGDGTTPPSKAFIARFSGSQPELRSCAAAALPPGGRSFETATGRAGLVVRIIRFKESLPGTFDVWVSFSNLPPGGDRFRYRIFKIGTEWKVTNRQPA